MRTMRVAAVATAAAATVVLAVQPVQAETGPTLEPITVSPSSGTPGTVFTIAGEGCEIDGAPGEVDVFVGFADGPEPDPVSVSAAEDGTWSYAFTTDADDALGDYLATATCYEGSDADSPIIVDYDFVEFELKAPTTPSTESPNPTAPTMTPTAKPAAPTAQAKPATPVVAKPTFTG